MTTPGSYRTSPETECGFEAWVGDPDGPQLCLIARTWDELLGEPRMPHPLYGIAYDRPTMADPKTTGTTETEEPVDFYLATFLSYTVQ